MSKLNVLMCYYISGAHAHKLHEIIILIVSERCVLFPFFFFSFVFITQLLHCPHYFLSITGCVCVCASISRVTAQARRDRWASEEQCLRIWKGIDTNLWSSGLIINQTITHNFRQRCIQYLDSCVQIANI